MDNSLTFCISTYNNLNYLKLAIHSVRTYSYYKDSPFIVFAENCSDGTEEWLVQNKEKYNLQVFIEHNDKEHTKGIGGGMNMCASHVETEYIMFLHSDFFVSKDWDRAAEKMFEKYPNTPLWVSSWRFQPNIFKEESRPGTTVFPLDEFGCKHDDFKEDYYIEYAEAFKEANVGLEVEKGEGVSGLIRKKDWDYIGGNDPLFAPASWEDTDLFIRMQLAGYKFVMPIESVVFHFGARGSHFPKDDFNQKSERQTTCEINNSQKFYKKWGWMPVHNQYQFFTYPPNIEKEKYQHLIRR